MAEGKWNDAEEPRLKPNDKKRSAESAELGQWVTATKRAFVDMVKVDIEDQMYSSGEKS